MGTIVNVIKTMLTTSGGPAAAAQVGNVTRAQNRLGQASANAGRSFAAQSKGLGGLVAAYAGAAATLFAVQAAYEALAQAARAETIVKGTKTLAAVTAQSGPAIIATIKEITDGQLTMAEAAQNANIGLSAGFSSKQIEQFALIAQKASMALGRDFTDSLQRVVRGVSKLEPELLDELGIFTRIEPAVQKYARQLGISASTMNEFQRRQAFANAAIEEGNRKFSMIDTTASSLQKSLEQLRVRVSELFTSFMQGVGSALLPFIDFLTNNVGAGLLAFGLLLSKVFGKALEEIGAMATRSSGRLSIWADSIADKSAIATKEITKLRTVIEQPMIAGGLKNVKNRYSPKQTPEQVQRFKDAVALQRTATDLTPSQLNQINAAYKEQTQYVKNTTDAYKGLNNVINANSAAIKSAGKSAIIFTGISNTLRVASAGLMLAIRGVSLAINGLFWIVGGLQLIGTLFDVDLLGKVVGMFRDMSRATAETATGFKGLATAAAGGGATLTAELNRLGASPEQIAGFGDLVVEQLEIIKKSSDPITKIAASGLASPIASARMMNFATQGSFEEQIAAGEAYVAELQALTEKETVGFWESIFVDGNTANELDELLIKLLAAKTALQGLKEGGEPASRAIAQIAATSGLSAEQIATNLAPELKNANNAFTILGITIQKVNDQYSLDNLTKEQRKLIDITVLSRNTITEFNAAIRAGAVTVTSVGSTIAGLEANLIQLKDAYNKIPSRKLVMGMEDVNSASAARRREVKAEIDALDEQVVGFRAVEAVLVDVEKRYSTLNSVFSSDLKILDTAGAQGLVDSTGAIATSQEQINKNQAEWLQTQIQSTAYTQKILGDQKAIDAYVTSITSDAKEQEALWASITPNAELYAKSVQAVEGKIFNITTELYKLSASYKDLVKTSDAEIAALTQQNIEVQLQVGIDNAKFKEELATSTQAFEEEFRQNKIRLVEQGVKAKTVDPIAGAAEINAIMQESLAAQKANSYSNFLLSIESITAERLLLKSQREGEKAAIDEQANLQKAKLQSDYTLLIDTAKLYTDIAAEIRQAGLDAGNAMGEAVHNGITKGSENLATVMGTEFIASSYTPLQASKPSAVAGPGNMPIPAAASALDRAIATARIDLQAALTKVGELAAAQKDAVDIAIDAEYAGLRRREELILKSYLQSEDLLVQKAAMEALTAAERLKEAEELGEAGEKIDKLQEKMLALFDAIKGVIESTLMDLNNLIFYGEGNFRDIASNFFKSMQQNFFQQTLLPTISEKLTTGLFSLFGVDSVQTTKGERGLTYENNALLVKMVNVGDIALGGQIGGLDPTKTKNAVEEIFGPNSFLVTMFNDIFGKNGVLSSLFGGLFGQGGILSGLFGGILSIFGGGTSVASGGFMHLAQGGAATSSLVRDRIPAMLEPGEFVVRKPIVSAVGLPAMQSLNATGSMSGGAPIINFTNEGSPKSVAASPPRFDGEKYVIDIITRDLANNGPIRKTLRGGF